jgi:peptide/nickel transport system substrate-binding protein
MKARKATLAATAALLALSAAACSGTASPGDQKASNQPSVGSTASAGLPTTDYTKLPYDQVKQGGTLTLAVSQLPTNWNNNTADGALADTSTIEGPLLGSGSTWAADGSFKVDPNYAESIKVVKDSPTVIDVKLNPKAVWSDGSPITYKDMVATWKALNGKNTKYSPAATTGFEDITEIKEVGGDQFHYTVTFDGPYAEWWSYVYPFFPHQVGDTPDAFNNEFKSHLYPTNGPYVISNVDQNGGVVTEVPNPKWWGRKPKLDKIVFRAIDQAQTGQAFANGEIDWIDTGASVDVLKQAESRSGAVVQRSGGVTYTHLTMNAEEPPLTDINVRKAIFYAINRQQFASITQKGLGVPPVTVGSGVLLPGQAGYHNVEDQMYPYSKEKAQESLKAAGYTIENGKAMKDGKQLTLSIVTPANTPTNNQRCQLIQNYLGQVGIKVNINNVPLDKYFADYVVTGKNKNFELTSFSWVGTPTPLSGAKSIYTPANSGQNYFGISTPELGKLFKQASQTLDTQKRLDIINQIDKAIYEEAVIVTFTATPNIGVSNPKLVNYGEVQFETTDWTQVGFKS